MSLASGQGTFPSREVFIQSAALIVGLAFAAAVMNLGYRYFIGLEKISLSRRDPPAHFCLHPRAGHFCLRFPLLDKLRHAHLSALGDRQTDFYPDPGVLPLAQKEQLSTPCGIVKAALFALPYILIVAKEDLGQRLCFLRHLDLHGLLLRS